MTTGSGGLTGRIESEIQLLQRHMAMLKAIMEESQPIGIIRLSDKLNLPQHKVRYSLRILEQEGLIVPSPDGAKTTDGVGAFLNHLQDVLDEMNDTVADLKVGLG